LYGVGHKTERLDDGTTDGASHTKTSFKRKHNASEAETSSPAVVFPFGIIGHITHHGPQQGYRGGIGRVLQDVDDKDQPNLVRTDDKEKAGKKGGQCQANQKDIAFAKQTCQRLREQKHTGQCNQLANHVEKAKTNSKDIAQIGFGYQTKRIEEFLPGCGCSLGDQASLEQERLQGLLVYEVVKIITHGTPEESQGNEKE